MTLNEKSSLISALQRGTVTVVFKKINTDEIRVMPCTLNPSVLTAEGVTIKVDDQNPQSEQIVCWALDKSAWRSFIADTVVSWEVHGDV